MVYPKWQHILYLRQRERGKMLLSISLCCHSSCTLPGYSLSLAAQCIKRFRDIRYKSLTFPMPGPRNVSWINFFDVRFLYCCHSLAPSRFLLSSLPFGHYTTYPLIFCYLCANCKTSSLSAGVNLIFVVWFLEFCHWAQRITQPLKESNGCHKTQH